MERYTELCKQFLLLDNPEAIQVIFTGWEAANPKWPAKLKAAPFAGNVGACARMQKMSLLQYEADQNAAGR